MAREPIKRVQVTLTPMELLQAISDFWSAWPQESAALNPGAFITYEDTPIADMVKRTIRAERAKR